MKTKQVTQYAPTLHDFAGKALLNTFHDEYRGLSEYDAMLVRVDFLDAEIPGSEYRSNIGKGNLQIYANVMQVRAKKGW